MRLRWSKGKARSVVAGVAAAATLLAIGAPAAMAGGGGGNQPGSGGGLDAAQFWQYRDGPDGSWGPATSLDSVRKAMKAAGVTILDEGGSYNGPAKAQAALDQARRECESGFNQRHPSEADRRIAVSSPWVLSRVRRPRHERVERFRSGRPADLARQLEQIRGTRTLLL